MRNVKTRMFKATDRPAAMQHRCHTVNENDQRRVPEVDWREKKLVSRKKRTAVKTYGLMSPHFDIRWTWAGGAAGNGASGCIRNRLVY